MTLSIKDMLDLVSRCEDQLRQYWIGFATLSYGIPLLLAEREDVCNMKLGARTLDTKEWPAIVYPLFAIFFIYAINEAHRNRRAWIGRALACPDVAELPRALAQRWRVAARINGQTLGDIWLWVRILVVLVSAEYAIIEICTGQAWFAGTKACIERILSLGWWHLLIVPLAVAAFVGVGMGIWRLTRWLRADRAGQGASG